MSETIWIVFEIIFAVIVAGSTVSTICGYNYQVVATYQRISETPRADKLNVQIYYDNYPWWPTAFMALFSTYMGAQINRSAYLQIPITNALLLAIGVNLLAIGIGITIGRAIFNHRTIKVNIEAFSILGCFENGWQERAANSNIIVFEHDGYRHKMFLSTPPKRRKYHYPVFAHKSAHTG